MLIVKICSAFFSILTKVFPQNNRIQLTYFKLFKSFKKTELNCIKSSFDVSELKCQLENKAKHTSDLAPKQHC